MEPVSKPKKRRRALQFLLTLLGLYALLALFVMLVQRKLIYYPSRFPSDAASQLAQQEGFREWRNKAGELIGWHMPARSTSTGAVLIVHGNAGCAFHRSYIAEPIHAAASVDVYVLEYPGYGCRGGKPSQQAIFAAADEAVAALADRSPLYVVSESIGTGPATYIAGKHPTKISGLTLFAPYNKLTAVGQAQMPFLPVGLLLWDRYDPAAYLTDYRGPVKIVLAERDTIIPPRFGQRLHDGYQGPKAVEVIPGAGHNDIAARPPEWWQSVFSYWQSNRP